MEETGKGKCAPEGGGIGSSEPRVRSIRHREGKFGRCDRCGVRISPQQSNGMFANWTLALQEIDLFLVEVSQHAEDVALTKMWSEGGLQFGRTALIDPLWCKEIHGPDLRERANA